MDAYITCKTITDTAESMAWWFYYLDDFSRLTVRFGFRFRCCIYCGKWTGKRFMRPPRSGPCWSRRARRPSGYSCATGWRPPVSACSPATSRTPGRMRLPTVWTARCRCRRRPRLAPCSGCGSNNASRPRPTWNGLTAASCSSRWTWLGKIRCTTLWSPSKDTFPPAITVSIKYFLSPPSN